MKKIISLLILTLILWLFVGIPTAKSYVGAGDTAPDFTLVTIDGDTISLTDYAGQLVLLNFFHYN